MYRQRYKRTKPGFLVRLYCNMRCRVEGIQRKKRHLYRNLPLLDKESFYKWAHESPEFHKLFKTWMVEGYPRTLTPSVDRIDSDRGYVLSNMEWVTHSENSRRGACSPYRSR